MKKIIIVLSMIVIGIASSMIAYFFITNQKKLISITSHDNTVLDLGEYKVKNYRKSDHFVNKSVSFDVRKIDDFKKEIRKNDNYKENLSSSDIYIYRIKDSYFSVWFQSINSIKITPNYVYCEGADKMALFSFPQKYGIGSIFSIGDVKENLKISYDRMWVNDFDQFKEFYKNFNPIVYKLKDEDTILLKGYEYRTNEFYDELIIEFKKDTEGIVANIVNYW